MLKRKFFVAFFAISGLCPVYGQEKDNVSMGNKSGWYVGLQGGLPFGISTFSSFGADKTHPGWSVGAFGGYRFNPVFSLETQVAFSKMSLTVQDCCLKRNYWYGLDGIRYNAPVFGLDGCMYADLKSVVSMQRYGMQANINILGFFPRTKNGRWTVELSPLLSAVGTKADIQESRSGKSLNKKNTKWHLGAGGNLQASYRIAGKVNVGVYSGLTYLTGSRLDGMPEYLHKNNYVWESGIRLGVLLGKKNKKTVLSPVVAKEPLVTEESVIMEKRPQEVQDSTSEVRQEEQVVKIVEASRPELSFPIVRFSFNSVWIEPSERGKVAEIARLLKENPESNIRIEGYADSKGADAANERVSKMRAEAVKNRLVDKFGIDAKRITAVGMGVDRTKSADEARRAEMNSKVNE